MYTYPTHFALAEGHFRLNPSPRRAPDGPRRNSQAISACLDLELRPCQDAARSGLSKPFISGVLLALLLHLLCFGLVMAHAYYNLDKTAGGGDEYSGSIQVGLVGISALNSAGDQGSPGQNLRTENTVASLEPSLTTPTGEIPQADVAKISKEALEPPVAEETESPVTVQKIAVQKDVPNIKKQSIQPVKKRPPENLRHTQTAPRNPAGAATASAPNQTASSGTTPGGENTLQASASTATSSGTPGPGIAAGGGAGASSGGLTAFGGSDGPSFKRFVQPEYPAQARRQGVTGRVLLRVHINTAGVAERVEVAESANELLSKAALKAVERSSFHPLKRNGKPVACWTLLPISFSLERS